MLPRCGHLISSAALVCALAAPFSLASATAAPARAAAPVQQVKHAGKYDLTLRIGPLEQMYTQAQVKKLHPKTGEVMIQGTMAMGGMGMNMGGGPNHHLEVHVSLHSTGKPVSKAMVAIAIYAPNGKLLQHVPIAVMQGIDAGPSDIHFGNNVMLKNGHYVVRVQVNSTSATFNVALGTPMGGTKMPGM